MKLFLRTAFGVGCLLLLLSIAVKAQEKTGGPSASETAAEKDKKGFEKTAIKAAKKRLDAADLPKAISDNSFYIEEAYNQEKGVMQTITNCAYFRSPTHDVGCTITQEFPVNDETHQLSYTLPFSFLDSHTRNGVGDLLINYRYQLWGEGKPASISPRVSLILPTGNYKRGLGNGSAGVQFNVPVSRREGKYFVWHFNAGATFLPSAKSLSPKNTIFKKSLSFYNVGGSAIWLTNPHFNVMLEYVENFQSEITSLGNVNRYNEQILNPGVRFAIDIGKLQIVPGFSVPNIFRDGNRRTGAFFYLSFEHPFRKTE